MDSLEFDPFPEPVPGCFYTGDDWSLDVCKRCSLSFICDPDPIMPYFEVKSNE